MNSKTTEFVDFEDGMISLIEYKQYSAKIVYDKEEGIYVGSVLGINDSLNFYGMSVRKLTEAFHNCIDNYLSYCQKAGRKPDMSSKVF